MRVSTLVFAIGLGLATVILAPPAIFSRDALLIAAWASGTIVFALPLIWGLRIELGKPLDIRVTTHGVRVQGFGWVPTDRLKGATVEERRGFIMVRSSVTVPRRPLLSVDSRELANPAGFKAALNRLLRTNVDDGAEDSSPR